MKVNKDWLAILAVIPVFAFAGDYDSVVDDSVVGYWRFNDPSDYGKDSSGHGSGIVQWNNGASGGVSNGVELLKGTDPLGPNFFPGGGLMVIVR